MATAIFWPASVGVVHLLCLTALNICIYLSVGGKGQNRAKHLALKAWGCGNTPSAA